MGKYCVVIHYKKKRHDIIYGLWFLFLFFNMRKEARRTLNSGCSWITGFGRHFFLLFLIFLFYVSLNYFHNYRGDFSL